MPEQSGLSLFDRLVVLVAIGLGLVTGWFIGSYGAFAIAWLISMFAGPADWIWSLAVLCGIVGAAVGAGVGLRTSIRALRPAPPTADAR